MSERDPKTPKRLDVVRKIQRPGQQKPYWAPVGTISLWQDNEKPEGKRISGKLLLNIFGVEEFHVFEKESVKNEEE